VESVKFGIVGATEHPQLDYARVNYSKAPWATEPGQAVNYVACHDDRVLWDKLTVANPGATEAELLRMDLLSNTIVFTSQGVPFLPVGDEFLRTKGGSHNSYNLPDSVNQLDWARKARYGPVFGFYQHGVGARQHHRLPAQRPRRRRRLEHHHGALQRQPHRHRRAPAGGHLHRSAARGRNQPEGPGQANPDGSAPEPARLLRANTGAVTLVIARRSRSNSSFEV
jgi:pullulanase